jgi:hypothetical protein
VAVRRADHTHRRPHESRDREVRGCRTPQAFRTACGGFAPPSRIPAAESEGSGDGSAEPPNGPITE